MIEEKMQILYSLIKELKQQNKKLQDRVRELMIENERLSFKISVLELDLQEEKNGSRREN